MSDFPERLQRVQSRMAEAARRAGRAADELALVAVSKTHPPEAVREALAGGQTLFGESRVQEARAKIPEIGGRARWHFIGHLQKNKVRQALPLFELLHSVDSLELARDVARIGEEIGERPKVLLEVNLAGESSKFGFAPERLTAELETLLALPRLEVQGLMTIPPPAADPDESRPFFARLRELRDHLEIEAGVKLPVLSMGMSDDFEAAIEEGATLVRVGTALFGRREGKTWRPGGDA